MARVCIFCRNNAAKLTLEDVLPMWYLKRRQGLGLFTHVSWSGTGPEHRHESPLKVGVKIVCGPCNNVWMSGIQREASTFLEKMIDGQPITLDADGQRVVAAWIGRYSGQARMATYCCDVAATIQTDHESINRIDIRRDSPPFGATICLESFVAQVAGFSIPHTHVRFVLGDAMKFWCPIWPPLPGLVSWPPQESINEAVLEMLEHAFNPLKPK